MSFPHGKLEVLKVCMVIIRAIYHPLNPTGIPQCSSGKHISALPPLLSA